MCSEARFVPISRPALSGPACVRVRVRVRVHVRVRMVRVRVRVRMVRVRVRMVYIKMPRKEEALETDESPLCACRFVLQHGAVDSRVAELSLQQAHFS